MRRRALAALLLTAALGGCGKRGPLHPAEGAALPPKPALAATQPTPDQLLAPTTTARPQREEELLRKSEVRQDDRFNLPPPG